MKWRFIPFKHYDPYIKTALNKVAIDSVKKTGKPIVWLAGWKPSCVNIGYGQKIKDVINLEEANKLGLVIVRRQGGGGAMYLDKKGEITWNIIAPEEYLPKNINKIYEIVCNRIVEALKELDIPARHKPINDVVTRKGKVSGSTVKKEGKVVYVAGTLLYYLDINIFHKVLIAKNLKKVSSIKEQSNASFKQTLEALKKNLLSNIEYQESDWNKEELLNAEELAKKYKSKKWIYQK